LDSHQPDMNEMSFTLDELSEMRLITDTIMDELGALNEMDIHSPIELRAGWGFPKLFKTKGKTTPSLTHTDKTNKTKQSHTTQKASQKKSHTTHEGLANKKQFSNLDLIDLTKSPNGKSNKPVDCMKYVDSVMTNVTEFHRQISEEVKEFIANNDNPDISEIAYWITEVNKLNTELTTSKKILTELKLRVQKNPKDVIKALEVLVKDDIDMKTKFNEVVKKNQSPSKSDLTRWKLRMGLMKEHLMILQKKIKELGEPRLIVGKK
jgi:hypothetical protein